MSQREPFGKANLDREALCCSVPTDPLYASHLTILLQGMLTLGVKQPFAQFRPDASSTWQEVSQASASNQSYLGQLCSTQQLVWHRERLPLMSVNSGVAVSLIRTLPMSCNAGKTGFMKPHTPMRRFERKDFLALCA
jgi:hypothetical protein